MDDFFRNQHSPRDNPQVTGTFVSPPRNGGGPLLPRRFTNESGRVPTMSTITTIPRAAEPQDFATTTLEKKRMDYERLREHRRRFEAEIHKLDAQQRMEERELHQMQEDLAARYGGHQSEPTTPPEYRDTPGFPSIFSRPNRYSTSSLTSPPGIFNRPSRSGSLLTSPLSGTLPSRFPFDEIPSRSVPGSRRNSDEDEKEEAVRQDPTSHRSTNALNRYSMPVTRSRTYLTDIGLEDSNNTTGFLFGDEDSNTAERTTPTAPVGNPDSFQAIFRQQAYQIMTSASSAASDLGLSQTAGPEHHPSNGWNSISKHRHKQSMSTTAAAQLNGGSAIGSPSEASTIGSNRPANVRHSIEGMKLFQEAATTAGLDAPATSVVSPPTVHVMASPPKLHQSYSAGDVPAVKPNGTTGLPGNMNNHAQQHFHHHNASMGRIPAGAVPGRHNRELSGDASPPNSRETGSYPSISSTLQASAPPFGPGLTQSQLSSAGAPPVSAPAPAMPYPFYPAAHAYNPMASPPAPGYNALPMMMQNLTVANGNPGAMYPQQNYTGYNPMYAQQPPAPRPSHQDSQARVIQNRRQMDSEAMARFHNLPLEQVGGTIYSLCKDQHGCRYLQKQLENRIPEQIHMIWLETNQHVVELMTDPFGNYLCQKLLEYCDDDERTVLIQNATSNMVTIALNQHGTRALQKMIEHVTTQVQINLIVEALRNQVVELIQDLNGNHVIQKCLNKLSAADSSFIFDAVGKHCVEVGTHRHGCCVLQRCIDHADGAQKVWLIERITDHAVTLVQDPFGNYVVQYIIDLNEETFTEPLVQQFQGRISALSKHKFSSNVVEKCLRCASDMSRDIIVTELLNPGEIERLLRDSFGNYVIQTALDYAPPMSKHRLIEAIRPILPSIRATPYGRRIQAKIQTHDTRVGPPGAAQGMPTDPASGQISLRPTQTRAITNGASVLAPGGYANGVNGAGGAGLNGGHAVYPSGNAISGPAAQNQAPLAQQQPQQAPPRTQQFPPQFAPVSAAENGESQWV
ncbi:armadillo-type protein [Staphylotrichum tortipilum]|uniref:Armadillo-type protein n=1 Tax=Staphylotrichum tortipilum TaxID=2831512 RepID=A0AAN6MHQ3_9PEZI|nr:armadillo-type protein [Staphylotrichum longicolle]